MTFQVVFNKVEQGEIELSLLRIRSRLALIMEPSEEVHKECKELFEAMENSKEKTFFSLFSNESKLSAIQSISPMILRHTSTIVKFESNIELSNYSARILGRVLGFMPFLRNFTLVFDDAMNVINLMNYLNFQHRKFKCEVNIHDYNVRFSKQEEFDLLSHILKGKLQNSDFVLHPRFSQTLLGENVSKVELMDS